MGDDIFTVYVLYSKKFDKTYTGITSHLILRFYQHNEFDKKGWSVRFRPWIVIYCEWYASKKEAVKREKWLKSGIGRKFINDNIAAWSSWYSPAANHNPGKWEMIYLQCTSSIQKSLIRLTPELPAISFSDSINIMNLTRRDGP